MESLCRKDLRFYGGKHFNLIATLEDKVNDRLGWGMHLQYVTENQKKEIETRFESFIEDCRNYSIFIKLNYRQCISNYCKVILYPKDMNTFSVVYISHNNHYPYYYILCNDFSCRCPALFENLGKNILTRNSLPTDDVLSKLTTRTNLSVS